MSVTQQCRHYSQVAIISSDVIGRPGLVDEFHPDLVLRDVEAEFFEPRLQRADEGGKTVA